MLPRPTAKGPQQHTLSGRKLPGLLEQEAAPHLSWCQVVLWSVQRSRAFSWIGCCEEGRLSLCWETYFYLGDGETEGTTDTCNWQKGRGHLC